MEERRTQDWRDLRLRFPSLSGKESEAGFCRGLRLLNYERHVHGVSRRAGAAARCGYGDGVSPGRSARCARTAAGAATATAASEHGEGHSQKKNSENSRVAAIALVGTR